MHMLHDMGKTLDSDMHFGLGRSGGWSIRKQNDTLMYVTAPTGLGAVIRFTQKLW